jgi:hypothetical protein
MPLISLAGFEILKPLESQARPGREAEILIEEGSIPRPAVVVEDGAWIPQQPVTNLSADVRPSACEQFEPAAEVELRQRAAATKLARQGRREDQNAGKRLRGGANVQKSEPPFDKRPQAADSGARRRAEEELDARAAERADAWKLTRIETDFGLEANESDRIPREPPSETDIGRVELTRIRRRDVGAHFESTPA